MVTLCLRVPVGPSTEVLRHVFQITQWVRLYRPLVALLGNLDTNKLKVQVIETRPLFLFVSNFSNINRTALHPIILKKKKNHVTIGLYGFKITFTLYMTLFTVYRSLTCQPNVILLKYYQKNYFSTQPSIFVQCDRRKLYVCILIQLVLRFIV